MSFVPLDVAEGFQSSVYNALTGFYRQSISTLRTSVEHSTIGLVLESSGDIKRYKDWRNGDVELGFGWAAAQTLRIHVAATPDSPLI